jgi:hypothetical protein
MAKKEPRIKYLSAKQAEMARKIQARKVIPPWWQVANENTRIDLHYYSADQILGQIEKALKVERCPADELLQIQVQAKTFQLGMDRVRNSTKAEAKNRSALSDLFYRVESMINALDNSTGFDLFDQSTWTKANSDTPKDSLGNNESLG